MAIACEVPEAVAQFLHAPTPDEWLDEACNRLPEMLLDHANCELKAASTALGFLYRYPDRGTLAQRMSKLAREELRHFEQVRSIMDDMEIPFERLSASRYAGQLRDAARQTEPHKLLDMLLIGALIEARSWADSMRACWLPKRDISNTTSRSPDRSAVLVIRRSMNDSPSSRTSRRRWFPNRIPTSAFIRVALCNSCPVGA
jgi:tRNA isopentenyl-2-thiomethyl-A-37 hydroxylase MiaE